MMSLACKRFPTSSIMRPHVLTTLARAPAGAPLQVFDLFSFPTKNVLFTMTRKTFQHTVRTELKIVKNIRQPLRAGGRGQ